MKYEDISAYSHPFAPVVNFVFVSWVLFLPICKSTSDHATYLKDAAHSTVAFTLTTDSKFDSRMSAQLHQEVKDYLTRGCVNQTRVHSTYEKKNSLALEHACPRFLHPCRKLVSSRTSSKLLRPRAKKWIRSCGIIRLPLCKNDY